jgi:PAS domain S-box-containing protein
MSDPAATTLVVIDDDPDVLRATERILLQAHYQVITGASAAEALELTRRHRPALLLLDVMLPDGNGLDIARKLKSEPALAGVFVILVSGLMTSSDDQAAGLASGLADGYIARPFGKAEFLARIDAMLRLRSAQEALRKSEASYRALTQTAADAIVIGDAQGNIRGWNTAAEKIFGYTEAEALGKPLTLLMPKRYQQGHEAGMHRMQEDATRDLAGKTVDLNGVTKAGTEFPVELSLSTWQTSEGVFFTGIIRDITQRKRNERLLQESEQRFRGLIEQSLTGIYITQNDAVVYANPRLEELLGYASGELVGIQTETIVMAQDRPILWAEQERLRAGATSGSYELRALRKDGTVVEIGVQGSSYELNGKPATVGMAQDITEKKHAQGEIQRYVAQMETAFMSTVTVAMTLSEMRDPYTAGHERRVAEIAVAIGLELGFEANRQEGLRVAGYLHDVGKIAIPAEILAKPVRLNHWEFELVKGHAQAGCDVLKNLESPWPLAQVALQHHERIDGSGYPQGLKGDAILLEARIIAVADVVEAMASDRPYRPGLGIDKALAEIERGRGVAYDPVVADACLRLFREEGYTLPV